MQEQPTCRGCFEFKRATVVYMDLITSAKRIKQVEEANQGLRIRQYPSYEAPIESAEQGCLACQCWTYALRNECFSDSSKFEVELTDSAIRSLDQSLDALQRSKSILNVIFKIDWAQPDFSFVVECGKDFTALIRIDIEPYWFRS